MQNDVKQVDRDAMVRFSRLQCPSVFAAHRIAAEAAKDAEIAALQATVARLRENISHCQGRFLNINIALSSGGTKAEAIRIADVGEDCCKGYLTYETPKEPTQ